MPKEQIRKRGRRKPKEEEFAKPKVEAAPTTASEPFVESAPPQAQAGPSGLHPDRIALLSGRRPPPPTRNPNEVNGEGQTAAGGEGEGDQPQQPWGRVFGLNEEFPFGELDPDLKGYFRTVEDQIKDWEGTSSAGEQREGTPIHPIQHWNRNCGLRKEADLGHRSSKFPQFRPIGIERTRTQTLHRPRNGHGPRTAPPFARRLGT